MLGDRAEWRIEPISDGLRAEHRAEKTRTRAYQDQFAQRSPPRIHSAYTKGKHEQNDPDACRSRGKRVSRSDDAARIREKRDRKCVTVAKHDDPSLHSGASRRVAGSSSELQRARKASPQAGSRSSNTRVHSPKQRSCDTWIPWSSFSWS